MCCLLLSLVLVSTLLHLSPMLLRASLCCWIPHSPFGIYFSDTHNRRMCLLQKKLEDKMNIFTCGTDTSQLIYIKHGLLYCSCWLCEICDKQGFSLHSTHLFQTTAGFFYYGVICRLMSVQNLLSQNDYISNKVMIFYRTWHNAAR